MHTTCTLTRADWWDHFKARWGINRMGHRVQPGLYALGKPGGDSSVFVTANYTLSFDALRSSLPGFDCYILVLDTKGINVWCAAGKGTFGTDELVERIKSVRLDEVVEHRVVILPQLGAPGVSAHEVRKRTGFKVEYGPVRASDLPEYMKTREATPEMRKVTFPLKDRAVLIPVEIRNLYPVLIIAGVLFLIGMVYTSFIILDIVLFGAVMFPILLPWLPTNEFTSKGLILGVIAALPFTYDTLAASGGVEFWLLVLYAVIPILLIAPWVAYLGLNFTGSSTYTSRTGVRKEIFRYIPVIAVMFISGIALEIILSVLNRMGMI